MDIKISLFGLALVSALSVVISCSSSKDESNNTGGSSSSNAGTDNSGNSSSGGSGKGGSSSSSGGSSSNNAGTQSTGGFNGGSFNGGGFNFGGNLGLGGAFDPADYMCNPKPKVGTDCPAGTMPCAADTSVCYCKDAKWACQDLSGALGAGGAGGGQIQCPGTMPNSGDSCGMSFGFCPYGQNSGCVCFGGSWTCQ